MLDKSLLIELRRQGQKLRTVVRLGAQGLTDAVLREIDISLKHHELMKIRVPAEDRNQRDVIIAEICQRLGAEHVQRVGHVALLYRQRPAEPKESKAPRASAPKGAKVSKASSRPRDTRARAKPSGR